MSISIIPGASFPLAAVAAGVSRAFVAGSHFFVSAEGANIWFRTGGSALVGGDVLANADPCDHFLLNGDTRGPFAMMSATRIAARTAAGTAGTLHVDAYQEVTP